MKHIEVVAAILLRDNKILCVQRGLNSLPYLSKKYEFPGGKIEPGESNEQALTREIKEELELDIDVRQLFLTVEHDYPDFRLLMHSFIASSQSFEEMKLTEHIDHQWLSPNELLSLDWAAADIPIVQKLIKEADAEFRPTIS